MLNQLLAGGLENKLDKPLFHERKAMTSKGNEKMVQDFKARGDHGGAVFLGVQGVEPLRGSIFQGTK